MQWVGSMKRKVLLVSEQVPEVVGLDCSIQSYWKKATLTLVLLCLIGSVHRIQLVLLQQQWVNKDWRTEPVWVRAACWRYRSWPVFLFTNLWWNQLQLSTGPSVWIKEQQQTTESSESLRPQPSSGPGLCWTRLSTLVLLLLTCSVVDQLLSLGSWFCWTLFSPNFRPGS